MALSGAFHLLTEAVLRPTDRNLMIIIIVITIITVMRRLHKQKMNHYRNRLGAFESVLFKAKQLWGEMPLSGNKLAQFVGRADEHKTIHRASSNCTQPSPVK